MKSYSIRPVTVFFFVIAILFFSMGFMGCTTQTLVKVDPMVACDDGVDPTLLSEPCDKSIKLANGSTYQDGLNGKRNGDASLNSCGVKVSKLQQALAQCRAAVAQHNSAIDALNKK